MRTPREPFEKKKHAVGKKALPGPPWVRSGGGGAGRLIRDNQGRLEHQNGKQQFPGGSVSQNEIFWHTLRTFLEIVVKNGFGDFLPPNLAGKLLLAFLLGFDPGCAKRKGL